MNGLVVVAGGIVGGVIGGHAGVLAMMLWADMDGPGVLTWVPGGVAAGAAVGVYVAAQVIA